MKREQESINQNQEFNQACNKNEMNVSGKRANGTSIENENTNNKLLLTNEYKSQTETEDKFQIEEDLSRYNSVLKDCPKAKAYIRQISLIYPISKKTIEKMINARMTIEHHFKDTYEQNIVYGINQCFRFNKSRPSPAQVIAMITGDTVAELKQKELSKNKETKNELERIKEAKENYDNLRQEAFNTYRTNPVRKDIYKQHSMESIKILDELMKDFLSVQAHILSFYKAGVTGYGIGLTNHLSKISIRQDKSLGKRWQYCFTVYIRSKSFIERVIKNNRIGTEVPTAFIEYVKELDIERRKRYEVEAIRYGRHQTNQREDRDIVEDENIGDYEDIEQDFKKLDFAFLSKEEIRKQTQVTQSESAEELNNNRLNGINRGDINYRNNRGEDHDQ